MKQIFMILLLLLSYLTENRVSSLGSMSTIAVSYGEHGSVFCGLKPDGSRSPDCYGSNPAIISSTPKNSSFVGLTGGGGFVCGLSIDSKLPFCWGTTDFIPMGVPLRRDKHSEYSEISAGDNHLCALRKPLSENASVVDCWGYNMTKTFDFGGELQSISAGSVFNCGLFARRRNVLCWGDEAEINGSGLVYFDLKFKKIGAGGYHVCGILQDFSDTVYCRGRSLDPQHNNVLIHYNGYLGRQLDYVSPPNDPMRSVVGGKFHECGIRSYDRRVVCWGGSVSAGTLPPVGVKFLEIAAGNYFTCGVLAKKTRSPVCWGVDFPYAPETPITPGPCMSFPCARGFYKFDNTSAPCSSPRADICLPCSKGCPSGMYQIAECSSDSDRQCGYDCSNCSSSECFSNCSSSNAGMSRINEEFRSFQMPIVIAEISVALLSLVIVLFVTVVYVRHKLRRCKCIHTLKVGVNGSFNDGVAKIQPLLDEVKIRKAQMFTCEELERATDGFKESSLVGKGSFSCVYKGVLKSGTVVAVKRAIANDSIKQSKEFLTELDLLSRLNHAHLLSLLGYCDEGDERLLVYEFMANGSLHKHLHGKNKELKSQLDWVKRVTIAVQASRGIEYLHGYACPPVIHRDIKSSNILIDEEHNARVADFGLSLLVPTNSSTPLSELPAGTLGYLDPEYYRLHYLTTKSDVYSFGVLLLEILSGRKAIDMNYDEGNIVEWAVPLIKSNNIEAILDPVLKKHPSDLEALKRVVNIASKCVRMRGKERPSMDEVTTGLERALAILIGNEQPILPSEVVLGSSRLHKSSTSEKSINRPTSETDGAETGAPSWTTRSSSCDLDVDGIKNADTRSGAGDGSVVEYIGPGSPGQHLYLQHNF